jgi:hypothetical protein
VTVTLLFTDIEGSTELWEQHPQSMQIALARHDDLLKKAMDVFLRTWAMGFALFSTLYIVLFRYLWTSKK